MQKKPKEKYTPKRVCYGFLDLQGNWVIEPIFEDAYCFYDECYAGVKLECKWGFIDKSGKTVIEPQWDDAGNFSEGLTNVKLDGKWGFIDKSGKTIIDPQ